VKRLGWGQWKKIADRYVKTRTSRQVRDYAKKHPHYKPTVSTEAVDTANSMGLQDFAEGLKVYATAVDTTMKKL